MRLNIPPKNERIKTDCRWYRRGKGGACDEPNPAVKGEGGAIYHRKRKYCNPYICGSFVRKSVVIKKEEENK